ncbi:MAG: S41 family peptidase [Herpetosiphonaceae bacterium]|nr:S41 family peptidase [Herpetosiphonaceae bacterium]
MLRLSRLLIICGLLLLLPSCSSSTELAQVTASTVPLPSSAPPLVQATASTRTPASHGESDADLMATLMAAPPATTPPAETPVAMSSVARTYLTSTLDDMQQHYILSRSLDWSEIRRLAFSDAAGARVPADTYSTSRLALSLLHDPHSRFLTPDDLKQQQEMATNQPAPYGTRLPGAVGYLSLPTHLFVSSTHDPYAEQGVAAVKMLDQQGVCGWIIDLRNDNGGAVWPMLDVVGPILGEGQVGTFIDMAGNKSIWSYRHGQALLDDQVLSQAPVYEVHHPVPPVAVLTGDMTASAAEAIVVAFRGRPHTRSFGQPTAGVPTAPGYYTLSDGAQVAVTEALDVDRSGQSYMGPITPDEAVPPAVVTGRADDPVVAAALRWLATQPGCGR